MITLVRIQTMGCKSFTFSIDDFFSWSIALEFFLFTNFTVTVFVAFLPKGSLWQPSMYIKVISMSESLQIWITFSLNLDLEFHSKIFLGCLMSILFSLWYLFSKADYFLTKSMGHFTDGVKKNCVSYTTQKEIRERALKSCPCRLCKTYAQNIVSWIILNICRNLLR